MMKKLLLWILILGIAILSCGCQAMKMGTDSVVIDPHPTPWQDPAVSFVPRPVTTPSVVSTPGSTVLHTATPQPLPDQEINPDLQPPLLTQALQEHQVDFADISGSQLVLVYAGRQGTQVYCYEKVDQVWKIVRELSYLRAYVSKNGINDEKTEGDGTTPSGLYPLVFAFGHKVEADTRLEYRQITEGTYWVDDPDSILYNQWTLQAGQDLWKDADPLWEAGPRYNLAIVIGYNYGANMVRGAGSAIFFHCGDAPTNGGVCTKEANLKRIAKWLDRDCSPQILIAGES